VFAGLIPCVTNRKAKQRSSLSDEEYHRFATQFVDMILDSRRPWVFQHVLYGGLQNAPTLNDLNSEEFVLDLVYVQREGGVLWKPWVAEALITGDRERLVQHFEKFAKRKRLTKDEQARLLEVGKPSVLRKSIKELTSRFKSHRGPKHKLPREKYAALLATADLLQPPILKLLMVPETSRTLGETLQYLQRDHPKACELLLRHAYRLEQALNDPKLRSRAKKRISARARVLADAMAGADYDLTFRTSLERVGEARRARSRNPL
jgi:hypothetical protein